MSHSADQSFNQGNTYCLYNSKLISDFTPEMLNPHYWQSQNSVTGTAQGRGTTWFVRYLPKPNNTKEEKGNEKKTQHWVLRHYYRGGLIGKLIHDSYLFNGIESSRAMREYRLLKQMQQWQLPAPQPVACRVIRHGLFDLCYRADLLSSRIEYAQDLVAILSQKSISDDLWIKIGSTIRRFHDHHIYHHDLNSHNILINEQQAVYLIDFDRGEVRQPNEHTNSASWKESNISRLHRSFLKESHQLVTFNFTESNWQMLLSGYSKN